VLVHFPYFVKLISLTSAVESISSISSITLTSEATYSVNAFGPITTASIVFFTLVFVYIITGRHIKSRSVSNYGINISIHFILVSEAPDTISRNKLQKSINLLNFYLENEALSERSDSGAGKLFGYITNQLGRLSLVPSEGW